MIDKAKVKELVCDFCASKQVKWAYPTDDFEQTVERHTTYLGGWSGCDDCHEIVMAGDRSGLVRRCLEQLPAAQGLSGKRLGYVRERIRLLHEEFFVSWSGEAVPVEQYDEPYTPGVIRYRRED